MVSCMILHEKTGIGFSSFECLHRDSGGDGIVSMQAVEEFPYYFMNAFRADAGMYVHWNCRRDGVSREVGNGVRRRENGQRYIFCLRSISIDFFALLSQAILGRLTDVCFTIQIRLICFYRRG